MLHSAWIRHASTALVGVAIAATTIATSRVDPEPPAEYDAGVAVDGATISWARDFRLDGSTEAGESEIVLRLDMSVEALAEIDSGQLGVHLETADSAASLVVLGPNGAELAADSSAVPGAPELRARNVILGWEQLVDECEETISGTCSFEVTIQIASATPSTWAAQGFMGSARSPYTEPPGIIRLTRVP
ncbi:MAG: hypothetical protein H6719_10960 [Sandaracinaceae bacterium]|nr:hypothetical protein [Sandaracinaceae bacterium]